MKWSNGYLAAQTLLKHCIASLLLISCCLLTSYGQKGILKGTVTDGTTRRAIAGVAIVNERTGKKLTSTAVDGTYHILLEKGEYTLAYNADGYGNRIISNVWIKTGQDCLAIINLFALKTDSSRVSESKGNDSRHVAFKSTYKDAIEAAAFNRVNFNASDIRSTLNSGNITAANYKNGGMVISGLPGVFTQSNPADPAIVSLNMSGMGERYQQLLYNGDVFNYFDPTTRLYPLGMIPAEMIEQVQVRKTASGSLPSDFAGGSLSIITRDNTDHNFFYIKAGGGFAANTSNQNFYGDKRGKLEFMALPGSKRALPSIFPTTRSQYPLNSKNIQEQVYLSQSLKNNIAPENYGKGKPDEQLMIGFGKNFRLKKTGAVISIVGYVNQDQQRQYYESVIQTGPRVSDNPYPFTATGKPLIGSQSNDSNYSYAIHLSAVVNASIVYGKNKISFKNFGGALFSNTFSKRAGLYKPDEDTLAHIALRYMPEQRYFVNSQLAGEHALGEKSQLKLSWQATYSHLHLQNPDERNILLREDINGKALYEIATPSNAGSFTNSSRLWRNIKDNNFSGNISLNFPFNMLQQVQVLEGGIRIQQNYRVLNSDMLLVQGTGYVPFNKLLSPDRYYPGGLTVNSYFINGYANPTTIPSEYRGNYIASSNIGAAYMQLSGKLTNSLSLRLAARAESSNQLASNIYYNYSAGFKNPQSIALDENTRIGTFNFLPSISLDYTAAKQICVFASYFRSLNRPQLQELTKYARYDAGTFSVTTGNPLLATAAIDNYNAGVQVSTGIISVLSINAFYKRIDQPIEYIVSNYNNSAMRLTPHNTPPGEVKGIDASLTIRLSAIESPLTSGLSVFAGGTFTQSKVQAGPIRSTEIPAVREHELTGSPAYSINAGIVMQYLHLPKITLLYNRVGDHITALGSGNSYVLSNGNTILAIPDYRVADRGQLDIQIAQALFKSKLQFTAGISNLAADSYTTYQDLNGNKKIDSPLLLKSNGNTGGYFVSGTDNTISTVPMQRVYYISLSYLFY